MTSHAIHHGLSFDTLRAALHLPQLQLPLPAMQRRAEFFARPGLMERLAAWAERQPEHHRMGSYTRSR